MLALMGIIETMLFWVNSWIVFTQLGAHDVGGGMVTEGVDVDQRMGSDLQSVPCIALSRYTNVSCLQKWWYARSDDTVSKLRLRLLRSSPP